MKTTDSNLKGRTIIAHGLERFGNNKAARERVADTAFELSDRQSLDAVGVQSVYAFDIVGIVKNGEAEFQTAYRKFRKHVKAALVRFLTTID